MSTALYRRYRPENFAEVIGQEHVTDPLMQALRSNRVNHAYLFSGPRGCGKTTSARILARILNCARNTPETPTDTPCGECESCTELARGGPGSLDVVEIDAASHGGVDDARELRERATFSPSRDRFKIFILDEAHMVTAQGFNALLKIVEEPPEYLKFIFATTEPEKVIGTIRSRTHHYPFRLVAPDTLQTYLAELATSENISVGSGVLPLVVRAGGGSVRDSLSVLDQLMAGAEGGVLDYERAVSLLGFTHVTLLDDVVDALAARDGASMFRVVDHVVATGHEPRRFVEDLLERLRDLIVLSVSGESAQAVLRSVPADQLARMQAQATNLGAAELSRSADVVNAALTEMSGATSPRLHLELLCARLLLPAVDDSATGLAARLDRLERGAPAARPAVAAAPAPSPAAVPASVPAPVAAPVAPAAAAAAPAATAPAATAPAVASPAASPAVPPAGSPPWDVPSEGVAPAPTTDAAPVAEPAPVADVAPVAPAVAAPVEAAPATSTPATSTPATSTPATPTPVAPTQADPTRATPADLPPVAAQAIAAAAPSAAADGAVEMLRRRWPEVLETLSRLRKATWALVAQNAQVGELTDTTLRLTFASAGLATTFRNGPGASLVQQAVRETLGFDVRVEGGIQEQARPAAPATAAAPAGPPAPAAIDPAAAAASWDTPVATVAAPAAAPRAAAPQAAAPQAADASAAWPAAAPSAAQAGAPAQPGRPRPAATSDELGEEPPDDFDHGPEPEPVLDERGPRSTAAGAPVPGAPAGETPRQAAERRVAATRAQEEARARVVDDPQPDDEDLASSGQVGVPLVAQILGGVVIEEILDTQV